MSQVGLLPASDMSIPEVRLGSWYIATPDQGPLLGAWISIVPPPVGMWLYVPELSPEKTIVNWEPSAVRMVNPLVSSWPFSITSTAVEGASIVTSPVNCTSPQACTL